MMGSAGAVGVGGSKKSEQPHRYGASLGPNQISSQDVVLKI